MKINVKIVLFEKVQAMIVVLFIAVIIISFFLLFGINYYNLSDFMKIGIFLFIMFPCVLIAALHKAFNITVCPCFFFYV